MKSKMIRNKYWQRTFWVICFLVLWEILTLSGKYSPLILPPVEKVLVALYTSILDGDLIRQTLYSLKLIFQGFIIAFTIAVFMCTLSFAFKTFEGLLETILSIAHPLPGLALLPLIILWLGTGSQSIIFIIVHSVIWPLILNLLMGFKSIPNIYKQVGQNYELNLLQIVSYIMIPASLPYFLAGIRTGWARAWRAVIASEMIFGATGGTGGIGWYIYMNRVFMDTAGMFAGIIVIIVIGIIVEDLIFEQIEKITIKKWGMTI